MKPPLLHKPYHCPPAHIGDHLYCEHHGCDVAVAEIGALPIGPWPMYVIRGGARAPILTADLARAVRTESAQAVAHWWGVSRYTVTRWRRDLHAGRMTDGTRALWSQLAAVRLSPAARQLGGRRGGAVRAAAVAARAAASRQRASAARNATDRPAGRT